ncbi:hypothetical protein BDV98DRAFT_572076, partial [Pterulicium gracile]
MRCLPSSCLHHHLDFLSIFVHPHNPQSAHTSLLLLVITTITSILPYHPPFGTLSIPAMPTRVLNFSQNAKPRTSII